MRDRRRHGRNPIVVVAESVWCAGGLVVVTTALALLVFNRSHVVAAAACESLTSLSLPNTTITLAESVGSGHFTPPATGRGAPAPYSELPAFCRVALTTKPTTDSNIKIEVWMPAGWNGKFNAVGTGGWAGSIGYAQLRDALKRGYATSSTDTGHVGIGAWWRDGGRTPATRSTADPS